MKATTLSGLFSIGLLTMLAAPVAAQTALTDLFLIEIGGVDRVLDSDMVLFFEYDMAKYWLSDGQEMWAEKDVGFGSLMAADGRLIVLSSKGELIVAKADPEKFDETNRAQVLSGKCWSVPVLANGLLYARNSEGHVVCLDLNKK